MKKKHDKLDSKLTDTATLAHNRPYYEHHKQTLYKQSDNYAYLLLKLSSNNKLSNNISRVSMVRRSIFLTLSPS